MAKKIDLQNLINTNLASGVSIPAVDHRAVEDALVSNSYGTVITESYTLLADSTPNTTPSGVGNYYVLNYAKQGRFVELNGNVTNKTGAIVSNAIWFTFDATEYLPSSTDIQFNGYTSTGSVIKCQIQGLNFKVIGALGTNQQIFFDTKYFTQE